MLTIERAARRFAAEFAALPLLTRIGLGVLPLAGAFDVLIHIAAAEHIGHSGIEHLAHLMGIGGMVLVMAGVVAHGVRRHLISRSAANAGGSSHATR